MKYVEILPIPPLLFFEKDLHYSQPSISMFLEPTDTEGDCKGLEHPGYLGVE